jgi:hypothetical protein
LDGDASAGQVGEVINWETGDELTTLIANSVGLYQMRNRVYSPTLGRFMQRDPNATSMVLIESAAMHGQGIGAAVAAISPDAMYGDGHNLYQYLGSNPWQRFDALGLNWAELAGDALVAGIRGVRGGLAAMTSEYAANMEADLDWAMDWSLPDDVHSRTQNDWVSESFRRGMIAGFNDALSDASYGLWPSSEEQGIALASGGGATWKFGVTVGGLVKKVKHAGHHAFPRYIASAMGRTSKVLVGVPLHLYEKYHGRLDSVLSAIGCQRGRGGGIKGVKDYLGHPNSHGYQQRVRVLIQTLRNVTREFENEHGIKGMLQALDDALLN